MSTEEGGILHALMAKVEELGQVCERLSRENAELRAEVSGVRAGNAQLANLVPCPELPVGSASTAGAGPERQVSRRMLGKVLGAAGLGAVGAATLGSLPAAAANGSDITAGNVTTTESGTTLQYDGSTSGVGVVFLANDTTGFVNTDASFPAALGGWGGAHFANGIYGWTANNNGIGTVGVYAGSTGSGAGVYGEGRTGVGVSATAYGNNAAVKAVNSAGGAGIHATSSHGRGAVFGGSSAQVQLTPGTLSSHPKKGNRGDLYADKTGRLWFCKQSGATAHWHQIA